MKYPNIIVSVPSDLGAQKMGTALALDALLVADMENETPILKSFETEILHAAPKQRGNIGPYYQGKYAEVLSQINEKNAKSIASILQSNYPLVISGDHSNAIGIMAGIREHIGKDKKLGVLWIDAHADLHTPYTTPSGNIHGMSLAASMGFDNTELSRNDIENGLKPIWEAIKKSGASKISPKIKPEDVFFIGLRDFEIQEYHLIRDYKLQHYSPYDIKAKGLTHILMLAVEYFKNYDAVYVSFDVDVLDTSISTGTGTPVYNGLMMHEAIEVVNSLKQLDNIVLWEFTEINPLLDSKNSMCVAVLKLINELLNK
jgi:arginase